MKEVRYERSKSGWTITTTSPENLGDLSRAILPTRFIDMESGLNRKDEAREYRHHNAPANAISEAPVE